MAGSGALALDDVALTSLLFELEVSNLNESPKRQSDQWTDTHWE